MQSKSCCNLTKRYKKKGYRVPTVFLHNFPRYGLEILLGASTSISSFVDYSKAAQSPRTFALSLITISGDYKYFSLKRIAVI